MVSKINYGKCEDFLRDAKRQEIKQIFFTCQQTKQTPPPVPIGNQLYQPASTYTAAIILTAGSEVSEAKPEKKLLSHLYMTQRMEVPNEEAAKKWDEGLAGTLSALKIKMAELAPGIEVVDGFIEVA